MRVCDVCKRVGVEARTYTVSEGGRQVEVDRCAEDAQSLEDMLQAEYGQVRAFNRAEQPASDAKLPVEGPKPGKPAARKPAARAKKAAAKKPSAGRLQVKTVEEIEASKRK
ncbi:hypothetical protein AB0B15_10720 [Streptomyces sp. NPDC045456]|uniref:hypothetical protein n=1 Tax=Streptomyces sp. NPDC045456 TaxID=3155254 RepID=UPI0033D3D758